MQNLKRLKEESRLKNEMNGSPSNVESPMVAVDIISLQQKKQRKRSFLPTTKPNVSVETRFSVPIQVEEDSTDQKKPTKRRVSRIVPQPNIKEDLEEEEKKDSPKEQLKNEEEKNLKNRNEKINASRRTRTLSKVKQLEDALTIFESFKSTLKLVEDPLCPTRKIQKPKNIRKRMKKQKKEEIPQSLSISIPETTIETPTIQQPNLESRSTSIPIPKERNVEKKKEEKKGTKHSKTKSGELTKPSLTPVTKQGSLNHFLNKALKSNKNVKEEEFDSIGSPSSLTMMKPTSAPEPKKKSIFGSLFGKNKKKEKKVETPIIEKESALKESGGMLGVTRFIRTAVSLNKKRFNEGGFDLDLSCKKNFFFF